MKNSTVIYSIVLLLICVLSSMLFSCEKSDPTVTFDYNDGSGRKNETTVARGSSVEELKMHNRKGYQFDGWYCADEKWDFDKVVKKDTVLSAHWTPKTYTAHLDANGGECPVTECEMTYGGDIVFPEVKRDGFVLLEWVKEGEYTGGYSKKWHFESDMSFYARWLPCTPGSTVYFGSYEQDNDLENGPEPIEWLILAEKDGKYLLLSKYLLDGMCFTSSLQYTEYKDSNIRKWMTGDFYDAAFSSDEKEKISETRLSDVDVTDMLFLLNSEEVYLMYHIYDEYAYPTQYAMDSAAVEYYVHMGTGKNVCHWWLRDTKKDRDTHYQSSNQCTQRGGHGAGMHIYGVRPAMWVDGAELTIIEKQ